MEVANFGYQFWWNKSFIFLFERTALKIRFFVYLLLCTSRTKSTFDRSQPLRKYFYLLLWLWTSFSKRFRLSSFRDKFPVDCINMSLKNMNEIKMTNSNTRSLVWSAKLEQLFFTYLLCELRPKPIKESSENFESLQYFFWDLWPKDWHKSTLVVTKYFLPKII